MQTASGESIIKLHSNAKYHWSNLQLDMAVHPVSDEFKTFWMINGTVCGPLGAVIQVNLYNLKNCKAHLW